MDLAILRGICSLQAEKTFFHGILWEEQLGGASADAQSYWQGRFAACAFVCSPKLSVKNQKIPRIVRDSGGQCLPLAVAAAAAVDAADGLSGIFLRAGCVRAGDRLARRGALDADGRAAKAHLAVSADDDGLTAAGCG